jgi:hypothetical protein
MDYYHLRILSVGCLSDKNAVIMVEVTYMSKPSIFSKDYEKKMKKRRKKILLLIIVPIIGLTIFLITDFNVILNKGISIRKGINNILLNKSKDKEVAKTEVQKKPEGSLKPQSNSENLKTPQTEVTIENQVFLISLSDGQEIGIEYYVKGTEKSIKGILNAKDISYDISPSKKSIVIQNMKNQDLLYVNINKVTKDITKKTHKSSKDKTFSKEDQLKKHPNYLWSITPKFIDEDNIAYVSELPWINEKAMQYIWKVNLKDDVHMQVKPASGKSITFKNITTKGLETHIDGDIVYVTPLGKVIK